MLFLVSSHQRVPTVVIVIIVFGVRWELSSIRAWQEIKRRWPLATDGRSDQTEPG